MYTYKDFITGNIKKTRGEFSRWSEPTGPLSTRYAIFENPKGVVAVPEYLLTKETREKLMSISEKALNALVITHRFAGTGETVLPDEISWASELAARLA
jgi:hypothetical protein